MTATTMPPMSSPRIESSRRRRAVRWLLPAALLAFTPKCFVCVLAYAGLGAALGLGGPEICGARPSLPELGAASIAMLITVGVLGLLVALKCFRSPSSSPVHNDAA